MEVATVSNKIVLQDSIDDNWLVAEHVRDNINSHRVAIVCHQLDTFGMAHGTEVLLNMSDVKNLRDFLNSVLHERC